MKKLPVLRVTEFLQPPENWESVAPPQFLPYLTSWTLGAATEYRVPQALLGAFSSTPNSLGRWMLKRRLQGCKGHRCGVCPPSPTSYCPLSSLLLVPGRGFQAHQRVENILEARISRRSPPVQVWCSSMGTISRPQMPLCTAKNSACLLSLHQQKQSWWQVLCID